METITEILPYLIGAALVAVVAVLFAGVFAMARGGDFGRRNSNRLMRARVALQGLAILLMLAFWLIVRN